MNTPRATHVSSYEQVTSVCFEKLNNIIRYTKLHSEMNGSVEMWKTENLNSL